MTATGVGFSFVCELDGDPRPSPGRYLLLNSIKRIRGGKRTRQRPLIRSVKPMFGEWLSLVEHLVRDQGVGGSNPLSPTILNTINDLHPPSQAGGRLLNTWMQYATLH
jgi:hypothetical protein